VDKPEPLSKQVADFAGRLTRLLNNAVTDGIRLKSVVSRPDQLFHVGWNITKNLIVSDQYMPLRHESGKPRCYLYVSVRCILDPEQTYLTVQSSTFAAACDPDGEKRLFHVDYEREKRDGYPEAHLQVYGKSEHFSAFLKACGEPRDLSKLHFPAGNRRYRTTLEDVIDFLAAERMVPAFPADARAHLEASRREFYERQLRAAVRRHPDVAAQALNDLTEWTAERRST
jgi:hypothetical protein